MFEVLDCQLDGKEYITGDYSIADIACAPWAGMHSYLNDSRFEKCQNVINWLARVMERPAVQKALTNTPDNG